MQDRPSKPEPIVFEHSAPHQKVRRPEDQQAPDRWAFDPWRRTRKGTAARQISDGVAASLAASEKRQRQRKPGDVATFAEVVDAVVASLLRCQLDASQSGVDAEDEKRGWVRLSLSSRRLTRNADQSRYDAAPMPLGMLMTSRRRGKPERKGIIDLMVDLQLIWLDKAPSHSDAIRASAIKCRDAFLELIDEHSPRLDELEVLSSVTTADGEIIEPELIELRAVEDDEDDPGAWGMKRSTQSRSVEYSDNEQTTTWRDEMRRINDGLATADITFDAGNGVINGHSVPDFGIALYDRTLKRIFNNGRWEYGGRLYGGFWQTMHRELRQGLRIGGERVISLDFSAMYLQLLYAVKARKQTPLDGDLYEGIDPLEGWPEDAARREAMRDAIKRNVSAMLFAKSSNKPHRLVKGTKPALSKGLTGAVLEARVKERHPDIAGWFRRAGIGFELMHYESEIMISVVLRCLEQGVLVLPIHDGLLVAEKDEDVATAAMMEAFREYTGGFIARVSG